ncbi:MAG: hypothetical protein WCV00_13100 [Verrucomicrobiia bacterium]
MMRKLTKYFAVVLGVLFVIGVLVWYQTGDRVIAESRSSSDKYASLIIVRELQIDPLSIGGVLRICSKMYRLEYYRHADWPMFSCHTLIADSYEAGDVRIEWQHGTGYDEADVVLDKAFAFHCKNGSWQEITAPNNR